MTLQTYQYGDAGKFKGLRIGVARHTPRGVRRDDYVSCGYFDVWLPVLAPTAELAKAFRGDTLTAKAFFRRYRDEMREPAPKHVIELLAATALRMPVGLGCFCEDASRCHRSALRELVLKRSKTSRRTTGAGVLDWRARRARCRRWMKIDWEAVLLSLRETGNAPTPAHRRLPARSRGWLHLHF